MSTIAAYPTGVGVSVCNEEGHVVKAAYLDLGLLYCRCGDDYHWVSLAPEESLVG